MDKYLRDDILKDVDKFEEEVLLKELEQISLDITKCKRHISEIEGIPDDEARCEIEEFEEQQRWETLSTNEKYEEERMKQHKECSARLLELEANEIVIKYKIKVIRRNKEYITYNYSTESWEDKYAEEEDAFDRSQLASLLAEKIINTPAAEKLNIGIIGEWGQGKTYFMELMKGVIENSENIMQKMTFCEWIQSMIVHKADEKSKIHIIDFDAATFDSEEKLWANLARALFQKYETETNFSLIRYNIVKLKRSKPFRDSIVIMTILFLLGILFTYINTIFWDQEIVLTIISIIFTAVPVLSTVHKMSLNSYLSLSKRIIGSIKLPNYIEVLGTKETILSDLELLFLAWFGNKKMKIIFFVDDLDRCKSKSVSEFFQTIHLLQKKENLHFIFAIDPNHIYDSINASNNASIKDNEIHMGKLTYVEKKLEKYVTQFIPINHCNKLRYIENKLEPYSNYYTEKEKKTIIEMLQFSSPVATPRKIKLIIEQLISLKKYYLNKRSIEVIDVAELLAWYIYCDCYPLSAYEILNHINGHTRYCTVEKIKSGKENIIKFIDNMILADIYYYDEICSKFIVRS